MSAESVLSVPCVVFAMRRESMYFRRAYPVRQHFVGAPCCAQLRAFRETLDQRSPGSVLMLETGIGARAMETALRWCLSEPRLGSFRYRPSLLLCAGFSGALQPEQQVGDLVLATQVVDQQGDCWPAMTPEAWVGKGIPAGRLLTMPELVSDPREKRRLGQHYAALAVDMESAATARLCYQHDIPFVCLRVISDDWQTALSPHLVELLRHARVSIPHLASKLLRHPLLIGELWRLAGQTRRAARRLLSPLSSLIRDGLRTGAFG